MGTVVDDVRSILGNEFGLNIEELQDDTAIFSTSLLDSLSSVRLLMALESQFGISISPLDISLEDVDSVKNIAETVTRLKAN